MQDSKKPVSTDKMHLPNVRVCMKPALKVTKMTNLSTMNDKYISSGRGNSTFFTGDLWCNSFINSHDVCNRIFHTAGSGIVGRRRRAIKSHFLTARRRDAFLYLLTIPFLTYDVTFLYSLARLNCEYMCM